MQQEETRALRCPSRHKGRVVDTVGGRKSGRLKLLPPEKSGEAECFVKCPKCGEQIGISFTPN